MMADAAHSLEVAAFAASFVLLVVCLVVAAVEDRDR